MVRTVLVGTLAAVALFGVTWFFFGGSNETATASTSAGVSSARMNGETRGELGRDASLEERIAALEDEVKALRSEVRRLSGRPVTASTRPSSLDAPSPTEPAFEHAVRSVVEAERAREEEARVERRRDQWQARIEELTTELGERVGLADEQREQVAALWAAEAEDILPLVAGARSGEVPFREIREQIEAVHARTDEQVAQFLTSAQLEAYEELRPRGPGGRGGRGGPPTP